MFRFFVAKLIKQNEKGPAVAECWWVIAASALLLHKFRMPIVSVDFNFSFAVSDKSFSTIRCDFSIGCCSSCSKCFFGFEKWMGESASNKGANNDGGKRCSIANSNNVFALNPPPFANFWGSAMAIFCNTKTASTSKNRSGSIDFDSNSFSFTWCSISWCSIA